MYEDKISEQERLYRLTEHERGMWARGIVHGGVDEVGRGPLAGPVVAACVAMPQEPLIEGINDSKKLSPARRERLDEAIRTATVCFALGIADIGEIDELNIRGATRLAMKRAVEGTAVEFVLTDAERDLDIRQPQLALIHGDAISYQIAAASIVAKVHRDRMMEQYDLQYPQYGFARNKGYGTAEHMEALRKHGPCPIHRPLFLRKILGEGASKG